MLKKALMISCATLVLAGCGGPGATQSVTKAGEHKSGFMGLSTTDTVTVETAQAFKGVEEVILGSFVVGFATKKTDSAKAGGGLFGNGFGGKSTAECDLTGVDDETMQQITEAVYADFKKGMAAKGIKIVSRDALAEHETFKGVSTLKTPHEESQGGLFGTNSVTKYFAPADVSPIYPFMGTIAGVMGGFGFSNPSVAAATYADKTKQKILHAVFVVDFANSEKYGGWATSTSNVSVGQGLSVIPQVSKIAIIGGSSGTFSTNSGNVALGQPTMSEKPFADVTDATGEGEKALEVAANVVGLIGGVGTNKKRSFEFKARPDDFKAAAIDAISQANTLLINKIGELK